MSLRNTVIAFSKEQFPELHRSDVWLKVETIAKFFNSKKRFLLIFLLTLSCFLTGQIFHPHYFQWFHLQYDESKIIIDQRTTNLATIFSITLVVMGWLITNISLKETISYQLMFKQTYVYPIFYYIMSIIGCLMMFSMLRKESWIDLNNIVITATILILIALLFIVWLFKCLIRIVDPAFFYVALSSEVMKEVDTVAKKIIIQRKSGEIYSTFCKNLSLSGGIGLFTNLNNYNYVNITPLATGNETVHDDFDIFQTKKTFLIKDIKLRRISKNIKPLNLAGNINYQSYFRELHIGSGISENYIAFYFPASLVRSNKLDRNLKSAFKITDKIRSIPTNTVFLENLHNRLSKEVKESKKENVKKVLDIYEKIFELEDKIYNLC